MKVAGFVKTTLQDWEGKNACMILLSGCNFRCPYCNRPDLIEPGDNGIDTSEIITYIRQHKDFVNAVVITGGEPTTNPELYTLLKELKPLKVKIKIDTNGSMPHILDDIIGAMLVDKVCINIMAPLAHDEYSKAAGVDVDVQKIKDSIKITEESGISYEFRMVAVPGIIGSDAMLSVARSLQGPGSLIIQQFDPSSVADQELRKTVPYPVQALVRFAETSKKYIKHVRVRGI
ncbi:MAG: anaerobic ribonucleoside-triphosphate reductase activating protein [Candidatus Methanoplasma sp.]|jgi:pyruvate formate lyase activating enzyme|nr:anaerobic ribonucleoside-triphosphate reductase activating protein [Candidatus Methanoplasma sp.]